MDRRTLAAGLGLLVLAVAPAARADLLRLENGRVMHGTVERGFVDDDHLRIQLFSTGGLVKVRWDHLIAEDREKWQVDLGLRESADLQELKIPAHRITFVRTTTPEIGLVLNPDAMAPATSATTEVQVMVRGRKIVYLRGDIARFDPVTVEFNLVYTPQQMFEKRRDELQPNTGLGWSQLGDFAKMVGAYVEAKAAYETAQKDPDFAQSDAGKQLVSKLATVEILVRNQSLQQDLEGVKLALIQARSQDFKIGAKFYLEARDSMFRLMTEVKDPKIQKELRMPELAQRVETERRSFFQKRLFNEVRRRLRAMAYEKAREAKVKDIPPGTDRQKVQELQMKGTFEGARQYFTRPVTDDLWNGILKDAGAGDRIAELQAIMGKDPTKLTEEDKAKAIRLAQMEKTLKGELQDYWTNRAKSGFEVTSYGYGTFIVVKSDLKLTRKPPSTQGGGGRGGRQGAQPQSQTQAVDVIKTPDQWWEEAGANERVNWLLSAYAERGGLLEVMRAWEEPCSACGGKGFKVSSVASTGEEEAERCRVCNGAKVERKVRWR